MQALVVTDEGVSLRSDYPVPCPAEGEVPVRVLVAGICETDLQIVRGYMGFRGVLGHEFVGIAEAGRYRGRRVVGEINCSCHACADCLAGRCSHCPQRTVLGILGRDGALAERLVLPERNLHPVPDEVATDEAVFVEPLAAAFRIVEQVACPEGTRIVVLGDGRLGQLCAQVLDRHGGDVTVVGKHEEKLRRLRARNLRTLLLSELSAQNSERTADVVVDCTGSETGLPLALQLVRPMGTVVLKTTVAGEQTLALAPIVIDEVTVVGSRCGPFHRALEALERREVDVTGLVSARFPLSKAVQALDEARRPGVLKVLVDVS